jgi:hypothetical protein
MQTARAVCALLVLSAVAQAAESPFTGTWKLSLTNSTLVAGNFIKTDLAQITVDKDSFRIKEEYTFESGPTWVMTWDAKFDGNERTPSSFNAMETELKER